MSFVKYGPVVILRVTKGTFDKSKGRYSPDTTNEIVLSGNIQPVIGEDLNRVPEGSRLTDFKTIYLHEELEAKDILVYKGQRYQIEKVDDWDPEYSTIPHYRYIAQLEEELC
jgi:hypothetical protein